MSAPSTGPTSSRQSWQPSRVTCGCAGMNVGMHVGMHVGVQVGVHVGTHVGTHTHAGMSIGMYVRVHETYEADGGARRIEDG